MSPTSPLPQTPQQAAYQNTPVTQDADYSLTPEQIAQMNAVTASAGQQPYTPLSSDQVQQTVNAQGQTVSAVPDSTTPEATVSSFNNIPVNQLINPEQAPSAWATTNPAADLYTGQTAGTKMGDNQLIGAIADKLNIKQKKGETTQTLESQVLARLAAEHGVKGPQAHIIPAQPAKTKKAAPELKGKSTSFLENAAAGETVTTPAKGPQVTHGPADINDIAKAMHLPVGHGQDPWDAVAAKIGVNTSTNGKIQSVKVSQAEEAIRQQFNTPAKIEQLQNMLMNAGYFTSDEMPGQSQSFTSGNFDLATQQAVGALLSDTASANSIKNGKVTGKAVTWADMLNDQLNNIQQQGGIQEVLKNSAYKVRLPQATQAQMTSPAISAFETELGRAPTAAELGQLTSDYDAQQVQKYQSLIAGQPIYPDEGGVYQIAGVPSTTQAAAQYAMQNNPNEFFSHKVLSAAGILSNIIGGNAITGSGAPTQTEPAQ